MDTLGFLGAALGLFLALITSKERRFNHLGQVIRIVIKMMMTMKMMMMMIQIIRKSVKPPRTWSPAGWRG